MIRLPGFLPVSLWLGACLLGSAMSAGASDKATEAPSSVLAAPVARAAGEPLRVTGGNGKGGLYDPSLETGPDGTLWMSYSRVEPHPSFGAVFSDISTHIARSTDRGATWQHVAAVNSSDLVKLPFPHSGLNARWQHEVSRLVYDPASPPASRWKVFWHRYLRVYDGSDDKAPQLFEHGWIEMKTAASPAGPWSNGRKLFVGSIYNTANDSTIGPPEQRLDRSDQRMRQCLAFTEPGALAEDGALYVSLKCAAGGGRGQVVLLRCGADVKACTFVGAPLTDTQAGAYGDFSGFSATDLARRGNRRLLIVTPTRRASEWYHGCLVFEFADLGRGLLVSGDNKPRPLAEVGDGTNSINGACAYSDGLAGGFLFGQYFHAQPEAFRVYRLRSTPAF